MASLKELKNRISSIKSTQKITKAQKMVAASKLRRAQEQAVAARPYTDGMERLVSSLAAGLRDSDTASPLLVGTGKDEVHLIVVATSDRGLCGAFNSSIVRAVRKKARDLLAKGKKVKLLCVGKKGFEQLKGEFAEQILGKSELPKKISYATADEIGDRVLAEFQAGGFDVCHVVYNQFKSAISQVVTFQQLIPLPLPKAENDNQDATPYEYEPDEEAILADLLPKNLGVQVYRALLENAASEQGARMTAMDNATRNAGDMIKRLNITYNRTRQAAITKELIEIISGAEAV